MDALETLGRLLNDPRVKVTLSIDELMSCGNALRMIKEELAAKGAEIKAKDLEIDALQTTINEES